MSNERQDDELHTSAAMLRNAQDAWATLYPGQAIVQFDSEESFISWANTEPELMGVLSNTGADEAQPLHWYERREPTDTGQRNPACTLAVAHSFGNPAATTATATGGSATHADASSSAAAATRPAATVAAVGSGAPVRRRTSGQLPVLRESHGLEDNLECESPSFGNRARAHAASATFVTDAGIPVILSYIPPHRRPARKHPPAASFPPPPYPPPPASPPHSPLTAAREGYVARAHSPPAIALTP